MTRTMKVSAALLSTAMAVLVSGFVQFASAIQRVSPNVAEPGDGIVVLTGGQERIKQGVRLLQDGKGRRLLISGVNRSSTRDDVKRAVRLKAGPQFDCCVDFGYEALDTSGNAAEARIWAAEHHFRSLIVVTSSYHMPRSLVELRLAMPDVQLIAYPVVPRHFRGEAWWAHAATFRLILTEYLKFLPALARSKALDVLARGADHSPAHQVPTAMPRSRP